MGSQVSVTALLAEMSACSRAIDWAKQQTPAEAWTTCQRGDWLAFFLVGIGYDRSKLVVHLAAAASHFMPAADTTGQEGRLRFLLREAGVSHKERSYGDRLNAPLTAHAYMYNVAAWDALNWPMVEAPHTVARSADLLREQVPWSEVEPLITAWAKARDKGNG